MFMILKKGGKKSFIHTVFLHPCNLKHPQALHFFCLRKSRFLKQYLVAPKWASIIGILLMKAKLLLALPGCGLKRVQKLKIQLLESYEGAESTYLSIHYLSILSIF